MDTDTLVFPHEGPQPPGSEGTARAEPPPVPADHLPGPADDHPAPTPAEPPPPPESAAEDLSPPAPDSDVPAAAAPVVPPVAVPTPEAALLPLEQRVCRLEQAVAELQGQRGTRTAEPPGVPAPVANASPFPSPTAILVDVPRRMIGTMVGAAQERPRPAAGPRPSRNWLLFDALAEARAIVRMFLDPRYHLPWSARVLPLVLLAAILTSSWLPFMGIPLVGGLLNKVIDLVLAFLLFKVLGHEARRYRETAPDLPPTLRL